MILEHAHAVDSSVMRQAASGHCRGATAAVEAAATRHLLGCVRAAPVRGGARPDRRILYGPNSISSVLELWTGRRWWATRTCTSIASRG